MKCVRRIADSHIDRFSDEAAAAVVKAGTHKYCPKQAYKAQEQGHDKK